MFRANLGGFEYEISLDLVAEELKTAEVRAWLLECEQKMEEEISGFTPAFIRGGKAIWNYDQS